MLKNLLLIFSYVVIVTIAQILLKMAMNNFSDKAINADFFLCAIMTPKVIIGMFLYALSFLIWLVVLSKVEITFAYPLLSLSVILVAVISWLFMEETFNLYRISGMILTIFGAWLVVRS